MKPWDPEESFPSCGESPRQENVSSSTSQEAAGGTSNFMAVAYLSAEFSKL